jgi:hypothetical protein
MMKKVEFMRIANIKTKKFVKSFVRNLLVFLVIFLWIFSGWPTIWQNPRIPPEIQKALAAQVTIDSTVSTAPAEHLGGSPTTVFTSQTTGYAFYVDSAGTAVYSKTTDGGATWGAPVTVDAKTDIIQIAVWYDRWTPGDTTGNLIHIATTDVTNDDIWYRTLDTSTDTLSTGPVNITSGLGYTGTLTAGTNHVAISKATDGALYAAVADTTDNMMVRCTTTCTTATNWAVSEPASWTNGNDFMLLIPRLSGEMMFIWWDISATTNDLKYSRYTGTWSAFANIDTALDNTTYDASFGAAVDTSNGDVYLAYAASAATLGTDDDIRVRKFSGTSWTALTDVVTDSVCAGVSNCGITGAKIARDQNTGYLYVLYSARSTPGTASTGNLYWKYSTDGGSTWSSEFGPVYSSNDDIYGGRLSLMSASTQRIYATWYAATPDDLFGRPIAPKTYTQAAYRFFNNTDSTDVGTALAAQDTAATLGLTGAAFRLRMLLHVGVSDLFTNEGSFKLQFAQRGTDGVCDTSFSGETYSDVTTSTVIAFYNNSTPSDGANLTANTNDPTHGSDTIVNQTYEELNPFTNSVAAISAGQDGKWDFALFDNNSTPTSTTYCFRIVKNDGSLLNTYSVIPQITMSAITDYITGSLGKTSDSWYGAIPVYLQLHGSLSPNNYPHARAKVDTPASETYYTQLTWNSSTSQFEGIIYVGSWYCNGCADPNTGTYNVTVQLDNDSNFSSIDYSASAGSFSTYVVRRWNAISTTQMGYGTEFNPTWNSSGSYWDYSIEDFSIGGSASARTNVAFAIPFHPITANISNISVTINSSSIPQGSPASTTDCWWWDNNKHTLYIQKASVAANTYYTVNLNFRSDTDLFMTRVDRVQTYNMGERLFSNGILFGNNYINTVIFGCGHEGEGEQIELTGRNFVNNDDVNLDCMERVAVHVDNTIRADTSNYYSADIKWKPNQCTNWIVSEDNTKIVWRVVSDDTASTGWAQQLNNYISATRTQEFYANKPYLKNTYEFKNNDSTSHIYPMVWGREQWLGTDRNVNDRGRYAGYTSNVIPETHILMSTSTLPENWFTTYDVGVYAAMGVIFNENNPPRYGYFLTSAAITNSSPWAEWVNYTSEWRVDDQQSDASGETDNIFFDSVWNNVAPNQTVSLTFWQWGIVTSSWDGIEQLIRQSYYETGGVKITQSAYRFFENQNSANVGNPLANTNTPASLNVTNQPFRLRLLLHIDTNELLQNGKYLKLQYAPKSGSVCGDDETFTDVTSTSTIAFYDNSNVNDGDALIANDNDPTHNGHTIKRQTYVESNNFINAISMVNIGEDGMWDFSLQDNGASPLTPYCFQVVKANISNPDYETIFYNVYPEITTAPLQQSLTLNLSSNYINLGILAPQIPVSATTTATVVVSGYDNGYYLAIKRASSTSTLALQSNPSITFPDYTPVWDPTANGGNGNATTTPGSTFSFRLMSSGTDSNYNSTWWGLNDNEGTAKFAGMPETSQTIMTCSSPSCQNGTTTNMILYRADAPISQPIGVYTGDITITALGNL